MKKALLTGIGTTLALISLAAIALPAVAWPQGRWTGGGTIDDGAYLPEGVRVTHGFELHNDLRKPNNLEVNWGGNHFHMTELTFADCWLSDEYPLPNPPKAPVNVVVGIGTGKYNGVDGYNIGFRFTDAGEPGSNDFARIVITEPGVPITTAMLAGPGPVLITGTVLEVDGNLNKGNHQAHFDKHSTVD